MEQVKAEKLAKLKTITCPRCQGAGFTINKEQKQVVCGECRKKPSFFCYWQGQYLYWGQAISVLQINIEKIKKIINAIINGLLVLFGIGGFLALIWQLWQQLSTDLVLEDFLLNKNEFFLIFWLSLLIDLYIYARLTQETVNYKKIPYRSELIESKKVATTDLTFQELIRLKKKETLDISPYYNWSAKKIINQAFLFARRLKHKNLTPIHLLAFLTDDLYVRVSFSRLSLEMQKFITKTKNLLSRQESNTTERTKISLQFYQVLFRAYQHAYLAKQERVAALHLLNAVVELDEKINDLFYDLDIEYQEIVNLAAWIDLQNLMQARWHQFRKKALFKPGSHMNRAMTARETVLLDRLSDDLTLAARAGAFPLIIGRDKELAETLRILKEPTGNILFVGEPGVGKTSMIQAIANAMAAEEVPKKFQDKRLVSLNTGALVAGASKIGELEWRLMQVIKEVLQSGNILLVIEDIHNLIGSTSIGSAQDLTSILMNYLSQGALQIVATTTIDEYKNYLANHKTFLRRFQKVDIKEVEINDAIKILEARSGAIEYRQKVYFTYDAIREAVVLSQRYIQDRFLPAKALDIIEEAAILAQETRGDKTQVIVADIHKVLSEKTNIQIAEVTKKETEKLLNLEELIHHRMINQEAAVKAVAEALRRSRTQMREEKKPIASFLFLGPTGVGKTELAKTVAEVYFGHEDQMIRLDMSEYQDPASIYKLIGRPGAGEQMSKGILTEAIRHSPFSLVLLDEFEKAEPEILNAFLQVFDDGRLTDAAGRTIDFSNTIIIATSNAGTLLIQEGIIAGRPMSEIKEELRQKELLKSFRPELINRFDEVIVFQPLSLENVRAITKLMLEKIAQNLHAKHGVNFQADDQAVQELAQAGFDPLYGARPLRRVIQKVVDNNLAELLLQKKLHKRDTVILENIETMRIQKAEEI